MSLRRGGFTGVIIVHLVLTKKSEPNLNEKDVFPHVCIDQACTTQKARRAKLST